MAAISAVDVCRLCSADVRIPSGERPLARAFTSSGDVVVSVASPEVVWRLFSADVIIPTGERSLARAFTSSGDVTASDNVTSDAVFSRLLGG